MLIICISSTAVASSVSSEAQLDYYIQGGSLTSTGNYQWWYGCSPTAAGMMIGYYDRNGYMGFSYGNLVPGGVAEANTFGYPGALVNNIIASTGHIADFYSGGYGASGDDVSSPTHSFNSLADFMGSNQDSANNPNGATTFWFYSNGAAFYDFDALNWGVTESSGMYGIGEYVTYAGYDTSVLYNQYIDTKDLTYGFTFAQYMAEIDAGRPVIVQVTDHSMLGYGYFTDASGANYINVYDTFAPNGQNPGVMTWGGTYQYGDQLLQHYGVTAMTLAAVPAPGAVFLGAVGAGFVGWLKRRRTL